MVDLWRSRTGKLKVTRNVICSKWYRFVFWKMQQATAFQNNTIILIFQKIRCFSKIFYKIKNPKIKILFRQILDNIPLLLHRKFQKIPPITVGWEFQVSNRGECDLLTETNKNQWFYVIQRYFCAKFQKVSFIFQKDKIKYLFRKSANLSIFQKIWKKRGGFWKFGHIKIRNLINS